MRENMVNIICIHWQKYLQDHTCLEYLAHSGALIKGDTRKDGQQTTLAQMSGRQGLSFLKDSIIMLSAICLLLTKQRLLSMAYLFTMGLHSRWSVRIHQDTALLQLDIQETSLDFNSNHTSSVSPQISLTCTHQAVPPTSTRIQAKRHWLPTPVLIKAGRLHLTLPAEGSVLLLHVSPHM
mgnify:CR=1 FL=1